MIEKIELFEGDKLIDFEISSFDLSANTHFKDGIAHFVIEIKISGKPFSAEILKIFRSIPSSIKVKITEIYKDMKSEIIIDNLVISELYMPILDETIDFILIQKWE